MPNAVEQILRNMRAERIRARKAKLPVSRPPIPKTLELRYSIQLRNFQRAINKEYFAALEPVIASYRQDATTEEIETVTAAAEKAISQAIVSGAILTNIVLNQGDNVIKWNDKRYSADIYQLSGFNSVPADTYDVMLKSWTSENVSLIKGINDDQTKKIETLLLRGGRDGALPGMLTREIKNIMASSVKRATLIARDQTLKLNGQIDRVKQTTSGITHFIWRTSRDERVRPRHRSLEGKKFAWDKPPDEGLPGQPVQCRCSAEPSFEELLGQEYAAKEVKA